MIHTQPALFGKMELYRLLALGYYYPDKMFFNEVKERKYLDSFINALIQSELTSDNAVNSKINNILSFTGLKYEDYESQYISDFETNIPTTSCSLYERHYIKDVKYTTILLELKAFYKNFDLNKSSHFNDSEDHIVLQLEFMHYLIFKELQAIESGNNHEPYESCRYDFLERHLVKWSPKFLENVDKNVKSEFHRYIAVVLNNLVKNDYEGKKLNYLLIK